MTMLIISLQALLLLIGGTAAAAEDYVPKNVYGETLQPCSSTGSALTGYTRTGSCVDYQDDVGSHHICIELSSASSNGQNFCQVTGQSNWCSSSMPCHQNKYQSCQVSSNRIIWIRINHYNSNHFLFTKTILRLRIGVFVNGLSLPIFKRQEVAMQSNIFSVMPSICKLWKHTLVRRKTNTKKLSSASTSVV